MQISSIAVIGLGYVGLPLAVEFAKQYPVIGFDINHKRVEELKRLIDNTGETESEELHAVMLEQSAGRAVKGLKITSSLEDIAPASVFIITVPTPINADKKPDLVPLLEATVLVGSVLEQGNIVIFESTVYPGCTEEECVPVLERESGLKYNIDFFCGYSPERINTGDKLNTLTKITKVTSGSTPAIATIVDDLYKTIITAGTHKAPSIKVAEAAKAIENAQRDLNISFVNELALIFDRIGIDTNDVLDAAGTKWNFLKFKPGLVGGHCIGVDPYYLVHKAEVLGYAPEVILSGRRVNEQMGTFVAEKVISLLEGRNKKIAGAHILILGITFKENCPDIRNSRVIDLFRHLSDRQASVDVYDPWAAEDAVHKEYNVSLLPHIDYSKKYDAVILAVAHKEFAAIDFESFKAGSAVIYDIKAFIDRNLVDGRL
jgi:UDP-N-acetyl-D-galactosamine dehydrogenase